MLDLSAIFVFLSDCKQYASCFRATDGKASQYISLFMHPVSLVSKISSPGSTLCLVCRFLRTPSKQKSPQEEKDIDIVELLRNVDPKEYEKYARMYGITDYRGLLQAIEQLKKEKAEESGRPVKLSTCS